MKSIIEEYPFVTVWNKFSTGVGKGLITEHGYMCKSKNSLNPDGYEVFPFKDHHHSAQFLAKVKSVDGKNLTGMVHLCEEWNNDGEENNASLKSQLIGKELIVEAAHWAGDRRIYRSVYPVIEYWSDLEIEVGEKIR